MQQPLFDIVLIEGTGSVSGDLAITEKGRALNNNNETLLRQAGALLLKVLASIKAGTASADDGEEDGKAPATKEKAAVAKEAGTFNQSDTFSLLQAALTQVNGGNGYDTYIADVYEDESYFVYRKGYNGGYFRVDFDVSTNGAVTLGNPETVVRKVTYIAPTTPANESLRETEIEETQAVALVEKAVAADGTVMLKLIAPGKGSSGWYTEEVLKRDGPRVFTKGLHNFIDHPTPAEESARPEGSLNNLGSTLVEDAYWRDNYFDKTGKDAGPGLYARAQVKPDFAESLDIIAPNIGTSIRAMGKARIGTIGDYKGPIIEAITSAKSVDYVTVAGAGGMVLSMVESARNARNIKPKGDDEMALSDDVAALRETVQTLAQGMLAMREAQIRQTAPALVEGLLAVHTTLPAPIRAKLLATLPGRATLTEAKDAIDVVALGKLVETAVAGELDYVQQLGISFGLGQITGFGSADPITESDPTKRKAQLDQELTEIFSDPIFGLTEAGAKIAATS